MNDRYFSAMLLLAILASLLAIAAYPILPARHFLASAADSSTRFVFSSRRADGSPAGIWLDDQQHQLRCYYDADQSDNYACSFNLLLTGDSSKGIDLSDYDKLLIELDLNANAQQLRLFMRNFNPAYSRADDANSTKFSAVTIAADEFHQQVEVPLNEFTVSDWWIGQYQIPRQLAFPERDNVVTLGVDFYYPLPYGAHELSVNKLEFVGPWISRAHWYLLILGCWLLGIFCYAGHRLICLRKQSQNDAQVICSLSRLRDQLQQESEQFRQLSNLDPLTKTYNRRGLQQILAGFFGTGSLPPPKTFVLIMADIDHFKRINDQYGHAVGDKVIQQVAQILRDEVRASDFVVRWGGEEFLVVLPFESLARGLEIAERVRANIAKRDFESKPQLRVTLSLGISALHPGESFEDLFRRADNALYEAKTKGRNCSFAAQ